MKGIFFGLLAVAFLTVIVSTATAQKCPTESGYQGNHEFPRPTKARVTVYKFNEIAASIGNKIQEQLRSRVGQDFLSKLKFNYGYAHDFDSDQILSASDVERIDAYDLVFTFHDLEHGLKGFNFKVVADDKGDLIESLALPDITTSPEKGKIIPCDSAVAIADASGFPRKRMSIYFDYDWNTGSFIWWASDSKPVKPDPDANGLVIIMGQGTYRRISIDANTGKVLKIYKETILF